MIEDLVMNTGIAEREDFFLISSWDGICASCEKPGQRSLRMYHLRKLQHHV
jgi:hypothetical protein